MIKLPKRTINISIILATLVAAVYYFSKHHNLLSQLGHLSVITILLVFSLYIVMFVVLLIIFKATVNMVNIKLSLKENSLVNAYSLFMNFFIPGQTGPAYRAYYLNKIHRLKVLDYGLVTIVYYLIYGLVSVILVFAGSQAWWLTIGVATITLLAAIIGFKLYSHKFKHYRLNLSPRTLGYILIATILQSIIQATIYFVELHSINKAIHIQQVITYTGAANLALFVALTPGAIGIRESFLLLSEKLHHISSANIVLANVIDRSVFLVFLLTLGLLIFIFKIGDRLSIVKAKTVDK